MILFAYKIIGPNRPKGSKILAFSDRIVRFDLINFAPTGLTIYVMQSSFASQLLLNVFPDFLLIFPNHFSRLCRSLEKCITIRDNGTLLYRP